MPLGWEEDPVLEERDPNGLNQHINVSFNVQCLCRHTIIYLYLYLYLTVGKY